MDKLTPTQRRHCMASIRSKNTRPEWVVRRFLFSHGFRYRIHAKVLSGTPDITLVGLRTCIFVNGCFWHGHGMDFGKADKSKMEVEELSESSNNEWTDLEDSDCCKIPHSNRDFWVRKIMRNKERDHNTILELKSEGWHTIEIWECQLKPKVREMTLQGLLRTLNHIQLENQGAKFRYNLDDEDLFSSRAAEDSTPT